MTHKQTPLPTLILVNQSQNRSCMGIACMKLSNMQSGCIFIALANFSGLCTSDTIYHVILASTLCKLWWFGIYAATAAAPLQFLTLGVTPGVTRVLLSPADDGFSSAINITGGFRFGNTNETAVYVSLLSCLYNYYNSVSLCMRTRSMNSTFFRVCMASIYKLDTV